MHEKAFNERADLSDVIDYAIRDWEDYLEQCHEEEISPIDSFEDFVADSVIAAGYRKQSEVAREIFEEIERAKLHIGSEIKVFKAVSVGEIEERVIPGEVIVFSDIAEIKKRYLEGKACTDCKHFVGCECFDGKTCDLYTEGDASDISDGNIIEKRGGE